MRKSCRDQNQPPMTNQQIVLFRRGEHRKSRPYNTEGAVHVVLDRLMLGAGATRALPWLWRLSLGTSPLQAEISPARAVGGALELIQLDATVARARNRGEMVGASEHLRFAHPRLTTASVLTSILFDRISTYSSLKFADGGFSDFSEDYGTHTPVSTYGK